MEIQDLLELWSEKRLKPAFLAQRVEAIELLVNALIERLVSQEKAASPKWETVTGLEQEFAAYEATNGSKVAAKASFDTYCYWMQLRNGLHIVFEFLEARGDWVTLYGAKILNTPAWVTQSNFSRDTNRPIDVRVSEIVLLADSGN